MTGDLRVYETVSLQELNVIGNSGNSTNNRGAFRILSNTQGGAFCENTQLTFTRWKSTIEALEKTCETWSKLTIKTSERPHWRCVFIVTLNIFHTFSSVSIVEFEQLNGNWVVHIFEKCIHLRYLTRFWSRLCIQQSQTEIRRV